MAILKADFDFNIKPIFELAKIFPEFNGRLLSLIGARGRKLLKADFLSGQELNLNKFPVDKLGRFTITSDVNKRRDTVKIYSYPVNLFERGRTLRDGSKEPGKYIVTRKLKMALMSRTGSYIDEFERDILRPGISRIGL